MREGCDDEADDVNARAVIISMNDDVGSIHYCINKSSWIILQETQPEPYRLFNGYASDSRVRRRPADQQVTHSEQVRTWLIEV
jgi:hypothetical protein